MDDPSSMECSTQGIGRRDFVATVLRSHRQCEPPDFDEELAPLGCGGRTCGPLDRPIDTHELVAMLFGKSDEARQHLVLSAELEPGCAVKLHISQHVGAQHWTSPGQGWAIGRNMPMSTLA